MRCIISRFKLSVDEENWEPKPCWMLKCWSYFQGYKLFLAEQWRCGDAIGWGGFVLKRSLN